MQVDPITPKLKGPGSKRLKLKHDRLLSICYRFAFTFNLRRYTVALKRKMKKALGRGLYSSTFQLNLSLF